MLEGNRLTGGNPDQAVFALQAEITADCQMETALGKWIQIRQDVDIVEIRVDID